MVIIPGLTQPLEAVGKRITTFNDSGSRLKVEACSVVDQAVCPQCAWTSSRVHGRCRRWLADCPCFGQSVTLEIYQSYNLRNIQMANSSMTFVAAAFRRDRSRARSCAVA